MLYALGQKLGLDIIERLGLALERAVRQTPAHGIGSIEALAHKDHLYGAFDADGSRQSLGAAPGGQKSQLNFGQTDLSRALVNDQSMIASQGELEPSTQAGAMDDGNGLYGELCQLVEQALAGSGNGGGLATGLDGSEFVQVRAGQKAAGFSAGHDQKPASGTLYAGNVF